MSQYQKKTCHFKFDNFLNAGLGELLLNKYQEEKFIGVHISGAKGVQAARERRAGAMINIANKLSKITLPSYAERSRGWADIISCEGCNGFSGSPLQFLTVGRAEYL